MEEIGKRPGEKIVHKVCFVGEAPEGGKSCGTAKIA
jgi:hypothetical protein